MIASRRTTPKCRPPPPFASERRRGGSPNGQTPCQITHCAIPVHLDDGPATLLYRNLTTPSLPDGAAALTASGQAPISNPHR